MFLGACAVFGVMALVAAWVDAANPSGDTTQLQRFLASLVSPWGAAGFVATAAFVLFGLWYLRAQPPLGVPASAFDAKLRQDRQLLILVLVAFALSLLSVSYLFISETRSMFRDEQLRAQATVARLRAQQIDRWLVGHTLDAQSLARSIRSMRLSLLAADEQTMRIVDVLLGEVLASSSDRTGIAVLSPDGRVLIGAGEDSAPDEETLKAVNLLKLSTVRFQIIDLHEVKGSKLLLRMSFVVPVDPPNGVGPLTMVVVVLTVDPTRDLFKQVVTWPVDSPGSEVVLVRREQEELVFLAGPSLLHGKEVAPLAYRIPMSRIDLPEVQAVLYGDATREGLDYRGVRVFAASHHVTDVPWFIVAKTDADVLMAPIRDKTRAFAAAAAAIIVITIFMVLLLWSAQRASYLSFRELQAEERAVQARALAEIIRSARAEPEPPKTTGP
jgi:hypothetical protein